MLNNAKLAARILAQGRLPRASLLRTLSACMAHQNDATRPIELPLLDRRVWVWSAQELIDIVQHNYLSLDCYAALPDVRTIVDAGAHVGLMTAYFRAMYPRATIHCFEPNARNFELLQRNFGHDASVHLHRFALTGAGVDSVTFYEAESQTGSVVSRGAAETRRAVTVPALDFSRLIERVGAPIDLFKLDIEGAEYDFLRGIDLHASGVRNAYIEFHSDWLRDFPRMQQALEPLLTHYRLDYQHVTTYGALNLLVYEVMLRGT